MALGGVHVHWALCAVGAAEKVEYFLRSDRGLPLPEGTCVSRIPLADLHTYCLPQTAYIAHGSQQEMGLANPVGLIHLVMDLRSHHLVYWRQFPSNHPRDLNSRRYTCHH
eukprot:1160839-Pelagomonas_calceolata.AAC.7